MNRITEPHFATSNVELLQSARSVMRQGHVLAAGCLARSSLEVHLRRLSTWHGCEPHNGRASIWLYTERLHDKGIIDRVARSEIKQAAKVGNRCAHGQAVFWADVATMLDSVLGLLTRYRVSDEPMADYCQGWDGKKWPPQSGCCEEGL